MDDYDKSDQDKCDKCQKAAFNQYLAYLYLENADQSKYGSILTGLSMQKSLCNDQYPKSLTEANNVLSNHKFDATGKPKKNDKSNKGTTPDKDKEKTEESLTLSFAQMEWKCYCCRKTGHKSPQCRHKDKPKSEWAINKAKEAMEKSHAQAPDKVDKKEETLEKTNVQVS